MKLASSRLRLYVRGGSVLIVVVAVALVLFKNRAHEVRFWFFGLTDPSRPINVVWLIVCTAAATMIFWWVAVLAWRLGRELRDLRHRRALEGMTKKLDERAAALNERERRVDDKLRRAIMDDGKQGGDD